jgi:hypothetical protein
MKDWNQWHGDDENPDSSLSRRLVVVQRLLRAAIQDAAEGPVNVISLCAGDGRDVIGVFSEQQLEFVAPSDVEFSVGAHRFGGTPQPLDPSASMFTFVV